MFSFFNCRYVGKNLYQNIFSIKKKHLLLQGFHTNKDFLKVKLLITEKKNSGKKEIMQPCHIIIIINNFTKKKNNQPQQRDGGRAVGVCPLTTGSTALKLSGVFGSF